jgi:predicted DsbA family dithiol-disulfide isomerase
VWAYVANVRLDELRRHFGAQIAVRERFCSVFGDVRTKMEQGWRDRGGAVGYRAHVEQIAARFPHVTLHPDAWSRTVPTTSSTPHACVKAAALAAGPERAAAVASDVGWRLRLAFFAEGRDVSRLDVQLAVVEEAGLSATTVRARLEDGTAWAALQRDYEDAAAEQVRGSPTFLANERRQMLYGNVGYKIIEANVLELLRDPGDHASWC